MSPSTSEHERSESTDRQAGQPPSDGFTTVLVGWDGLEPVVVRIAEDEAGWHEIRARLAPHHASLAEDLSVGKTTAHAADRQMAGHAARARAEALRAEGFVLATEPVTLEALPAPPPPLAAVLRTAWVASDSDAAEAAGGPAQLGGPARLPTDAAWPTCTVCGQPQSFVAVAPWPDTSGVSSHLYMCITGGREGTCTPRFSVLLGESCEAPGEPPPLTLTFEASTIPRWERVLDAPTVSDLRRRGVRYKRFVPRPILAAHRATTKLGGWPTWGEYNMTPLCRRCCRPMDFVWQLRGAPADLVWGSDPGSVCVFGCRDCAEIDVVHVR